jgi:glycosyltransferase involved in cell wall biosynthesis
MADVSILSLTNDLDQSFLNKYPNVHFYVLSIRFNGWKVVNLGNIIGQIDEIISFCKPDIVILCIEIWDLILELHKKISDKVAFCAICHAMPFLGSPLNPTKSFESDVKKFANKQILKYRKNYIIKHYKEFPKIINSGLLIANNATIAFYFKHYFPKSFFWRQVSHVTVDLLKTSKTLYINYDFCYMARMEKGKGVEYLQDLFNKISIRLGKKIRVAIMGRADDKYSQEKLRRLLESKSESFSIRFFGWADDKIKTTVLSRSGCFIYPSIYDNFPTVVNEAMAYGLPVAMWNNLFYRVNYSNVKSVSAAIPFNTKHLASVAVNLLQRKSTLSRHSIEYIKKNGGSRSVAKDDLVLFDEIINHYERNK